MSITRTCTSDDIQYLSRYKTPVSKGLKEFYLNFEVAPDTGLCHTLDSWLQINTSLDEKSIEMANRELEYSLELARLDPNFPFDGDSKYMADSHKGVLHENPRRLAWIAAYKGAETHEEAIIKYWGARYVLFRNEIRSAFVHGYPLPMEYQTAISVVDNLKSYAPTRLYIESYKDALIYMYMKHNCNPPDYMSANRSTMLDLFYNDLSYSAAWFNPAMGLCGNLTLFCESRDWMEMHRELKAELQKQLRDAGFHTDYPFDGSTLAYEIARDTKAMYSNQQRLNWISAHKAHMSNYEAYKQFASDFGEVLFTKFTAQRLEGRRLLTPEFQAPKGTDA